MGVSSLCRRYINRLPKGQVFVTRELLTYGPRDSVDKVLQGLVGSMMILRLARGVFVRNDKGLKMPSLKDIAEAKARAFAKKILPSCSGQTSGVDLMPAIKWKKKNGRSVRVKQFSAEATFCVIGSTSTFTTIYGQVRFQNVSARKYFVAQHEEGEMLCGIWHAGEQALVDYSSILRKKNFSQIQYQKLRELAAWVPEWIHEHLRSRTLQGKIHSPWQLYPFEKIKFPKPFGNSDSSGRVQEEVGVYVVDTGCGGKVNVRTAVEAVREPLDSLGVLIACQATEYNLNFARHRFSTTESRAPALKYCT